MVSKSDRTIKRTPSKIVGTVLYALVMSSCVSICCSHSSGINGFIEFLRKFSLELLVFHEKALAAVGILVFLTQYFCDEWEYSESEEYVNENIKFVIWGWLSFLGQVFFLPYSLVVSASAGIVAIVVVTVGLAWNNKKAVKRFVFENVIWGVALVLGCCDAGCLWLRWLYLTPILFVVLRYIWKWGLPSKVKLPMMCRYAKDSIAANSMIKQGN